LSNTPDTEQSKDAKYFVDRLSDSMLALEELALYIRETNPENRNDIRKGNASMVLKLLAKTQ